MALVAKGVVGKIYFNAFKEGRVDKFNPDNKFQRVVVFPSLDVVDMETMTTSKMGETKVDLGNCKSEEYNIKLGAGWHKVCAGDEIKFEMSSSEYNGKTYYRGKTVSLVKAGQGETAKESQTQSKPTQRQPAAPRDTTGISTGHALNGAFRFVGHSSSVTMNQVSDIARDIHEITERVKAKVRSENPQMSDYDSGAMAGHAVLNACSISKSIDDIEAIAFRILEIVPGVQEFIKTGKRPVIDTADVDVPSAQDDGPPWNPEDEHEPAFPSEASGMDDVPF